MAARAPLCFQFDITAARLGVETDGLAPTAPLTKSTLAREDATLDGSATRVGSESLILEELLAEPGAEQRQQFLPALAGEQLPRAAPDLSELARFVRMVEQPLQTALRLMQSAGEDALACILENACARAKDLSAQAAAVLVHEAAAYRRINCRLLPMLEEASRGSLESRQVGILLGSLQKFLGNTVAAARALLEEYVQLHTDVSYILDCAGLVEDYLLMSLAPGGSEKEACISAAQHLRDALEALEEPTACWSALYRREIQLSGLEESVKQMRRAAVLKHEIDLETHCGELFLAIKELSAGSC